MDLLRDTTGNITLYANIEFGLTTTFILNLNSNKFKVKNKFKKCVFLVTGPFKLFDD